VVEGEEAVVVGREGDGDRVKAEVVEVEIRFGEVEAGDAADLALFAPVDRFGGEGVGGGAAGANFDEDEGGACRGDDVQFTAAAAPVAGEDVVTALGEVIGGEVFAVGADADAVVGHGVPRLVSRASRLSRCWTKARTSATTR